MWAETVTGPSRFSFLLTALVFLASTPFAGGASAQPPAESESGSPEEAEKTIWETARWEIGPTTSSLGTVASVSIPAGYRFAGGDDTRALLESMGNPVNGDELGFITPDSGDWFVVFEFDDVGFVNDEEKDELDADALLQSIIEGTEAANRERAKRGWEKLRILGWRQPPNYNPVTHNLEWATTGVTDSGTKVVNYFTRVLGRRGVMSVDLVVDPESLDGVLPLYAGLMDEYSFKAGNTYAEYRTGDKVAKYGLAALITGGAVAIAAKSGFLKAFWKLIVVVAVGIGGFLKKLFSGRRSSQYPPA